MKITMKIIIVYLGSFLIGGSGLALLIVGSLSHIWLYGFTAILRRVYPYTFPILSWTLGIFMVIYTCILLKRFSMTVSKVGLITSMLFMAVLGPLVLFHSSYFSDAIVYDYSFWFKFRGNPYNAEVIDKFQQKFQCCGTTGAASFYPHDIFASCCPESSCGTFEPFRKGCNQAFEAHITFVFYMVGWTAIGLSILIAVIGITLGVIYSWQKHNIKTNLDQEIN